MRRGGRGGYEGGGQRYGGRDRNNDDSREGGWKGKNFRNKDREDRSTWDIRPTPEEVAKQKKLLWSNKKVNKEASSDAAEGSAEGSTEQAPSQDKNVGLWSSAITASGVGGDQANKFLKLMGIKNVPTVDPATRLKEESEKQKKVMRDLDRQYEIAREATHMGRGLGLGFHQ
ncbi:hypothetical protein COOONC_25766 [Cooperia oncophora]